MWLGCHAFAHSEAAVAWAQVHYSAVHLRRIHLGCKQPAIVGSLNLIDSCKASLAEEPAGSKGSGLDGRCRTARPCRSAAHLRFRNTRGGSSPSDAASMTSGQACSWEQCRSCLCQRGVPDRHHACPHHNLSPASRLRCKLTVASRHTKYGDIKDGRWPSGGWVLDWQSMVKVHCSQLWPKP